MMEVCNIDTIGLCDLADADFAEFGDVSSDRQTPRKQRIAQARAIRTCNRISVRRAKSQEHLMTILPSSIEAGDSWHVISGGDVDSMSFIQYLMDAEPWEYLLISTWCMAMQDVEQLAAWLNHGRLQQLDAYTGEILPSQYPHVHEALCALVRRHRGRVATFRNHSKIALLANGQTRRFAVIESSANINTNPRTEQTAITIDRTLFDFYAVFFGDIKSFNHNFQAWQPWQPTTSVN